MGLTAGALPLKVGHGASGMVMQAVAGPAFEQGGVVAAEEMARARRYEWTALQHIAAKIAYRSIIKSPISILSPF